LPPKYEGAPRGNFGGASYVPLLTPANFHRPPATALAFTIAGHWGTTGTVNEAPSAGEGENKMHGAGNSHLIGFEPHRPTALPGASLNDRPSGPVPQREDIPEPADGFGVPARYPMPMTTQRIDAWTPPQLAGALFRWLRSRLLPAATMTGASTDARG
jgi:hypothetical protein